ncbi:MAG: hypothetical protein NWR72_17295 [Bacteroidia bacterium]|nr:hypothetical protein [Bacteroidia bacterium]
MNLRTFLSALLMLPTVLVGQSFQPNAQSANWQMVSTNHFDVYHQAPDEISAQIVAKFAEKARHEALALFDVRPEGRYTLIYFPQAVDLLYSNLQLSKPEESPGLFSLPTLRGVVVHPGTTEGLYQNVKKEVTTAVLQEFAFGNRVGGTIQTKLLLHDAAWFSEGLEAYVSEGWTFTDEMWVNSLSSSELLDLALEGEGQLNRTVRKSIWYFIAHEYGEQKLSEIVYLMNISNSIESGIVSVLGITLNTVTSRWRDYVVTRANTQRQRRVNLSEWSDIDDLTLPAGYELNSFAWNKMSGQIAAWMTKEGLLKLFLYNPENRNWEATPLKMGLRSANYFHLELPEIPISWSPTGGQLVTVMYSPKGANALVYFSPGQGEIESQALDASDRAIWDLAWSHDGKSIVASVLREGKIDLYSTRAGEAAFKAITDDNFDDLDPSWSLDDQLLFFSSNRDSSHHDQASPWLLTESTFDIYSRSAENGGAFERLTKTSFSNERNPVATTSFLLKFLTDESGIWNLHGLNIFLKDREAVSNVDLGLNAWSGDDETVLLASPYEGKMHLFRMETALLTAPATPELTLLRLEQIASFQAKERKKRKAETLAAQLAEPEPVLPPAPDPAQVVDSPKTEEAPKKSEPVRYYIFDEEDQPYDIKRPTPANPDNPSSGSPTQPRRWSTGSSARVTQPAPDLDKLEVSSASPARGGFSADYLQLGFSYDPLAKLGLNLGVGFSDVLNRHNIQFSLQPFPRNTFSTLRYTYQPGKIDWYGEASYMNRQFRHQTQLLSDSLLFNYSQTRISGGMLVPISASTLLDMKVGWHYLSRIDQQVRRQSLLDESGQMLHAGAKLVHNQVKYQGKYRYAGWEGRLGWDSYYSLTNQQFAFHRLQGEVKKYVPLYKKIVFASRLGASFTLPNTVNQYYLGGVNDQLLVFNLQNTEQNSVASNSVDTSLYSFQYQEFVTAVRGFRPIARDGSRYLAGNFEIRFPISRMMRHGLNSNSLYSLEFIPFFDLGAVWTEGNPFSQKKPTDTRVVTSGNVTVQLQTLKSPFLMGFGSGVRMNILSYSLRGDMAWGIDDQTLTSPMIMMSLGKNF